LSRLPGAEDARSRLHVDAEQNGKFTDICVRAGFVKAAMVQAGDQSGYVRWQKIETNACRHASTDGSSTESYDAIKYEFERELDWDGPVTASSPPVKPGDESKHSTSLRRNHGLEQWELLVHALRNALPTRARPLA
jgi:hypothetical protein